MALDNELKGSRISLKKHDLELASLMFNYVDKDRARLDRFLPWVQYVNTAEDEKNYITQTHEWWEQGIHFDFGIFINQSTYVGNIGVHSISWANNNCELGYWILGDFEGQGYISEAVLLLEKHLFEVGFHRIQIRCSDLNEKSERVPMRCKYHLEGISREDAIEKGEYRNTKTFSKLVTDIEEF